MKKDCTRKDCVAQLARNAELVTACEQRAAEILHHSRRAEALEREYGELLDAEKVYEFERKLERMLGLVRNLRRNLDHKAGK